MDKHTATFQMGKIRAAQCILEEVGVIVKYSGLDEAKYALNRVWNQLYETAKTDKRVESPIKSHNKQNAPCQNCSVSKKCRKELTCSLYVPKVS